MRLFIGIPLPQEVKDYLFDLESELTKLPAKFKLIAKKNLHVTLKFIPEASEDQLKLLKEKLKKIKFNKFSSFLTNLDFFPNKRNIRVIWVGLENKNPFYELQLHIESELRELFGSDERFHPHITLGRVKFIKNKEEFYKGIEKIKINPLKFNISTFCLYESKLRKEGPEYKVLETYDLE